MTDTIYVDRVDSTSTRRTGTMQFMVSGHHVDGSLGGFQASTTSVWAASICQRALDTNRALTVSWQGAGPFKNIVYVDFADQRVSA